MHLNLFPFFIVWICLLVVLTTLIVWRKSVAGKEDDTLHVLDGDAALPAQQVAVASKLEQLDKWGKIVTVIVVVYGLLIGLAYAYELFVQQSSVTM